MKFAEEKLHPHQKETEFQLMLLEPRERKRKQIMPLKTLDQKKEYDRNYSKTHLKQRRENMRKYRENHQERVLNGR
jgi:hypothetical protein